jgi:N-acylneuraminate cytidylyltransferase
VPGKNLRPFRGRPLVCHTIEAAVTCGLFSRIVVSTDSEAIAEIAAAAGAEVPFLRAPELADDHTPVSLATVDAVERVDPAASTYTAVAQLMPACPLRSPEDILASYAQFVGSEADAQLSVSRYVLQSPWWAMRRSESHVLEPVFPDWVTARSQDLPAIVCPTGAVWWARTETLRLARTFHVAGRTGWEIPWPRGLDIDTEDDWALAEALAPRPAPMVCDAV